jgi:hypothetical protein
MLTFVVLALNALSVRLAGIEEFADTHLRPDDLMRFIRKAAELIGEFAQLSIIRAEDGWRKWGEKWEVQVCSRGRTLGWILWANFLHLSCQRQMDAT